MSTRFTYPTTPLPARSSDSRLQHAIRQLMMLIGSRPQPQAGVQPDWAQHVPDRVWRRHSMLLVSLHERHCGMNHE